jgi:hypothetical protein
LGVTARRLVETEGDVLQVLKQDPVELVTFILRSHPDGYILESHQEQLAESRAPRPISKELTTLCCELPKKKKKGPAFAKVLHQSNHFRSIFDTQKN